MEVVLDIIFYCVLERGLFFIIASGAQLRDIGLCKILVLVAELLRHWYILDIRLFVHRRKCCICQIVPRAGRASADIENARNLSIVQEKQRHIHGIFDVEEVALLLAVGVVRSVRLEKPDLAGGVYLLKGLYDETSHFAFVIFVRPEDVKIFKADNSFQEARTYCPQIKYLFGVAVNIQRPQFV